MVQTVRMKLVLLVAVSQFLQCGGLTCCSWSYEMYTDVPVGHMTQTLTHLASACC